MPPIPKTPEEIVALPLIEIRTAYVFTCEACGRDQYEPAIKCDDEPPPKPDDYDEAQEGEWVGEWVLAPTHVRCKACGAEYRTFDERAEDGEDLSNT